MPSEEERYAPPPSWVQEAASRATAEQFRRVADEAQAAADALAAPVSGRGEETR